MTALKLTRLLYITQGKLKDRILFHGGDKSSLLNHVDAKALPSKYGGQYDIPNTPLGKPLYDFALLFEDYFKGKFIQSYFKFFNCDLFLFFMFFRNWKIRLQLRLSSVRLEKCKCNKHNGSWLKWISLEAQRHSKLYFRDFLYNSFCNCVDFFFIKKEKIIL